MVDVYNSPIPSEMRTKLSEGDLGARFASYMVTKGNPAASIIMHAAWTFMANRDCWSNMGAFAQNYLETAEMVTTPHIAGYPDPSYLSWPEGCQSYEVALSGYYETLFDKWGQIVRAFANGEGSDV